MFAGQALLGSDELKFDRVALRFNNLHDWVGCSLVSREHEIDSVSGKLLKAALTLTPMEPIEHAADNFTLALSGVWTMSGSQQKPGFTEDFSIQINYDELVEFSAIQADVSALQDLITATTDSVTVPNEITLWLPEAEGEGPSRRAVVQAYAQQSAHSMLTSSKSGDTLLRLGDIGGLPALARWLSFVRDRRVVLGLMLSSTYSKIYAENKFFNAVSAAETLHRMEFPNELRPADEYKAFRRMLARHVPKRHRSWLSQQLAYSNEPRLRDRLVQLAEYGGLSAVIACDAPLWAKAVTDARNRMVHHDKGKGPGASIAELYWLAESLKIMVLLCLVKFSGFEEGCDEKMRDAPSIEFLASRVQGILTAQPS